MTAAMKHCALAFLFIIVVNLQCDAISDGLLKSIRAKLPKFEREARRYVDGIAFQEAVLAKSLKGGHDAFTTVQELHDPSPLVRVFSIPAEYELKILTLIKEEFHLNEVQLKECIGGLESVFPKHSSGNVNLNTGSLNCPYSYNTGVSCDRKQRYRTIDGSCNNLKNRVQGRSFRPLQRFLSAAYADGIGKPRLSVTGSPLPSARLVSSSISQGVDSPDPVHTVLFMNFGQFIDHDMSLTAISTLKKVDDTGKEVSVNIKCGSNGCNTTGIENKHCFPIEVPSNDKDFKKPCLMFVRSAVSPRGDCKLGPRDQLNQITSYLDASNVYGSSAEKNAKLRDNTNSDRGRLKMEVNPLGYRGYLPYYDDPECRGVNKSVRCFQAGDARVNEHPGLTSLHTMYHRYHNVIEQRLHDLNKHWSGERLYQESRKIVGAVWQFQVYNEFLPLLLGPATLKKYGLELERKLHWNGYDKKVNAEINNGFATAAYRVGHSMIPDSLKVVNKQDKDEDSIHFSQLFFRPGVLYKNYASGVSGVDGLVRGLFSRPMQQVDNQFTKEVTVKLFTEHPPNRPGLDLVALNIHRGQDHGLPGYLAWRKWCGLPVAKKFHKLHGIPKEVKHAFKKIYRKVQDIDLYAGGVSEEKVPGGIVGPTFACIIGRQFRNLRVGDRFWHEQEDRITGFTLDQLNEIRKSLISRVICDTTDEVDSIQRFALLQPFSKAFKKLGKGAYGKAYHIGKLYKGKKNEVEKCSKLPDIDLSKWAVHPNCEVH